jgi:hypothetical protein
MPVSTEKDFQSKIEKLENWLASEEEKQIKNK